MPRSTQSSGSKSAARTKPKAVPKKSGTSTKRSPTSTSGSKTGAHVRRCNSRYTCDPSKPGVKNILPVGSRYVKCDTCRQYECEKAAERKAEREANNLKLQKKDPDSRICPKCPTGTVHRVKGMGVRADGKLSNLCKVHFADQQNAQATRNMDAKREQGRKYEQGSHRKTIKAEWRDENPDKNKEYVAKSTQKKKHPVALVLSESDTESSESSEEILVARKKAPKKKA